MKKLSIVSLTLEALGVFKERTTIKLDTAKTHPIILIEGMNGCGKTTFLQTLQIGIYGSRFFGQKKALFNTFIRDLVRLDTISTPSVSIKLQLVNGNDCSDYTITREWKINNKSITETFLAYKNEKFWTNDEQHWMDLIDEFLPVALAELFFFDGEKIEEMANPDKLPEILKKATEALLGVGEIDSILTDLIAYDRRCLAKAKTETRDDQANAELLQNKIKELDALNETLATQVQSRANLLNKQDEAQKSLSKFKTSADQQGLQAFERATSLRAELSSIDNRLTELYQTRLKIVSNPHFPLVRHQLLLDSIIQAYKKESLAINGTQTSTALTEFDQAIRKRLEEQFPTLVTQIETILAEEKERLLNVIQRGSPFRPMNTSRVKDIVDELNREYVKVSTEIGHYLNESLSKQALIDAAPSQEKVEILLKKLSAYENDLQQVKASISTIDMNIESLRNLILRVKGQINNLEIDLKKTFQSTERLRYTLDASKRAQGVLATYKKQLLANKASWLSSAICQHFQELLRKKNFIHEVCIDPVTYDVALLASSEKVIPLSRLSAGERQMLATAVLRAIMSAKSSEIPVVVDTPLARLDGAHRMNLVKNFYTKVSHQVMILSTDEEISGQLKEEIERSVAHSYQFVYNESEQATNVMEN